MKLSVDPKFAHLVGEIESLFAAIEEHVSAGEFSTEPREELLRDLERVGIFKLARPECLGGYEAPPPVILEVLKKLAYFDGSIGWYCQAASTAISTLAAFLGDRAVDEMFCTGDVVGSCAGQVAPLGKAVRSPGG